MSDYTSSLLQLGASAKNSPAQSHVGGGGQGWMDAYQQQPNKSWADYYDAYKKQFGGQQPEGYKGGGYGSALAGYGGTPGNTQYQFLLRNQQNQMDQQVKEYMEWMKNYWAQQNQMQQGFNQYYGGGGGTTIIEREKDNTDLLNRIAELEAAAAERDKLRSVNYVPPTTTINGGGTNPFGPLPGDMPPLNPSRSVNYVPPTTTINGGGTNPFGPLPGDMPPLNPSQYPMLTPTSGNLYQGSVKNASGTPMRTGAAAPMPASASSSGSQMLTPPPRKEAAYQPVISYSGGW